VESGAGEKEKGREKGRNDGDTNQQKHNTTIRKRGTETERVFESESAEGGG
jgi:hypothetical protein